MNASTARAPSPLRRALRLAWLAVVAIALVIVFRRHGALVVDAAASVSTLSIGLAAVAMVAGVAASAMVWRSILNGLGYRLGPRPAARVFFLGQVGKYVPGSVWPVLAQMELGRDYAVPPATSAAAFALFMFVHLLSAVIVATLSLPMAGLAAWPWAFAALAAVLLLSPGPLDRAAALAARVFRRPLPALPSGAAMAVATTWALVMWLCYGVHLVLLAREAGVALSLAGAVGVFAVAWTAGFLFVVAPAGAGAREAILLALLGGMAPQATVLAVALLSRVIGTVADGLWAAVALAGGRSRAHS